jgi:hypothetical protein
MTLTAIGIVHGYAGRVGLVTRPIHLICNYIHATAIIRIIIAAFAFVVGVNGL